MVEVGEFEAGRVGREDEFVLWLDGEVVLEAGAGWWEEEFKAEVEDPE